MTRDELAAAAGMTPDEAAEWVRESRAAQGLPPTVEDPAALDRMAALVVPDADRAGRP